VSGQQCLHMHPTGSVSMLSSLAASSALMHCPACLTVRFQSLAAPRPLTVWNSLGVSHLPACRTRRSRVRSLVDVRAPRYMTASFSPHVITICRSELNAGAAAASAYDHHHHAVKLYIRSPAVARVGRLYLKISIRLPVAGRKRFPRVSTMHPIVTQ